MSIPILAFFNNKGGVGKTSLVYHLAWMYADLGIPVLAADLDPQANLTAAFLEEDRLAGMWLDDEGSYTIFDAVRPLSRGIGDVSPPPPQPIAEGLDPDQETLFENSSPIILLPGDLELSSFEDDLSVEWPKCLDGNERSFRVTSAFWRILQSMAKSHERRLILIDIGPNLGAINRAALIASDHVVIPLSPDLFSLQGLRNLGPTLRAWRAGWKERLKKNPVRDLALPTGRIEPVGYLVMQHAVRLDRPVRAYERWVSRIPEEYRRSVLEDQGVSGLLPEDDPFCLALLKHYRSLMPLAQDARKPMFHLKPADGAIGSHAEAAQRVRGDFHALASAIAKRVGIEMP